MKCLIFGVFETPFESCREALFNPNKSGTANSSGVPSILDTTCREVILNAIYSAIVVDPTTDLFFVLFKHTAPANTIPELIFYLGDRMHDLRQEMPASLSSLTCRHK